MIIERSFEQQSPEWFEAMLGNPGGSRLTNIITKTGKISKSNFIYKMADEILFRDEYVEKIRSGEAESFKSEAMENGNAREPEARKSFEFITGLEVEEVAMCYPDELKRWHVSPDGLIVGQKKGLEIKNPERKTQIEYLHKNELPKDYEIQVQGSMAATGYESWYFMSCHPQLPHLILEIPRDNDLCDKINAAVNSFLFDLGKLVKKLS